MTNQNQTYFLELLGYQNFKRIPCKNIIEARQAFTQAKTETYKAECTDGLTDHKWTAWELHYQSGELIKEGTF